MIDFKSIPSPNYAALLRPGKAEEPTPAAAPTACTPGPLLRRGGKRHFARLQAARDFVATLPQAEGDSLHGILTGVFDPIHLLLALLDALATPVRHLRVATLSLSKRNVQLLCEAFDAGGITKMDLVTSEFQRQHDSDIFEHLAAEFQARGQRVAAARNHAKVVLLDLADGRRYTLEGSANLRSCRNTEQVALTRSVPLHDWFAEFIDELLVKHATTTA